MPKNRLHITIEDCQNCPCATLKFDQGSQEDIMYCQTERSLIMLREGWGSRDIPNWCPALQSQKTRTRDMQRPDWTKESLNEKQVTTND